MQNKKTNYYYDFSISINKRLKQQTLTEYNFSLYWMKCGAAAFKVQKQSRWDKIVYKINAQAENLNLYNYI